MRPRLVIVAGAPGSGKTRLAERLAAELDLPLLSKDGFKETLGDALGVPSLEASRAYGRAAMRLLYATAGWLLAARVGMVLESNFLRGLSEADLRPLVARADAVQLHCWTGRDEALRRMRARVERGDRHPVHLDARRLAEAGRDRAPFAWAPFEAPLDLEVPVLTVDTTDGYRPDLAAVIAFARGVG